MLNKIAGEVVNTIDVVEHRLGMGTVTPAHMQASDVFKTVLSGTTTLTIPAQASGYNSYSVSVPHGLNFVPTAYVWQGYNGTNYTEVPGPGVSNPAGTIDGSGNQILAFPIWITASTNATNLVITVFTAGVIGAPYTYTFQYYIGHLVAN